MTDSASCANVLLLPFIFCTKLIPSMMQVDGSVISSAGETFPLSGCGTFGDLDELA